MCKSLVSPLHVFRSELIQLVTVTQKKAESSYRELIEQQIQMYRSSWLKVTEHLTDRNMPVFQPGTKVPVLFPLFLKQQQTVC